MSLRDFFTMLRSSESYSAPSFGRGVAAADAVARAAVPDVAAFDAVSLEQATVAARVETTAASHCVLIGYSLT
jgi:hypothetical protein